MPLPLEPPLPPMLAKLADELPAEGHVFEPKLDGFRCLVFRDGGDVVLQSRHGNPLTRYFPEVLDALRLLPAPRVVLDGELVAVSGSFRELLPRLHPAASRVAALAAATPASFAPFDVLAEGDRILLDRPLAERRARLEALAGRLAVPGSPALADAERWLETSEGVVAKAVDGVYRPGARGWLKVKRRHTADCVVAGVRWRAERPSSLLLGLWDASGRLEHVGIASSFGRRQAAAILEAIARFVAPLAGHPWEHGFLVAGGAVGRLRGSAGRWVPGMTMDWTPLRPELVAEVVYDQVDDGRFRHPGRFVRWRPDRDPGSCGFDQLA